jgi:putative solute:sodium symporter small subunit
MDKLINHQYQKKSPAAAQQARLLSHRYWLQYRHLTLSLLISWFALTFGVLFFARELSALVLFGWPVSVYMAAQGLTLFYVFLLALFSVRAGAIERRQRAEMETALSAQSITDAPPHRSSIATNQPDKSTWHD